VRAHERALVALDADGVVPDGNLECNRALLPLGRAGGPRAVHRERGHRQEIALPFQDHRLDALHEIGRTGGDDRSHRQGADLGSGRDLIEVLERGIDRSEVALYDFRSLFSVGLLDGLLDLGDRFLARQDAGYREEAGLHDRVDAAAHADFAGHSVGVDGVKGELLLDDLLLDLPGQVLPDLVLREGSIQEEDASGHGVLEHVEALEEAELVAGHEARLLDEVRRPDGTRSES
jgi:hypothetical protein